jgi:hypothetical protein
MSADISPASTDNTMRILSSAGNTGDDSCGSTPWVRANKPLCQEF